MIEKDAYWVVGGTTGSGRAIVKLLREMHFHVFATGVEVDVRSLSALHRYYSGEIEPSPCNLVGAVYCAGINNLEWLGAMGLQGMLEANDVLDVNLLGFIRFLDVLCRDGRRDRHPMRVVAISSDAATRPMRTSAAYCASKAGLNMAVKVAARELGPYGWKVNAVSPGMLEGTQMSDYIDVTVPVLRGWTPEAARAYEEQQAVIPGRIDPEQVAHIVIDVLTGPDHLNGAIIEINGGR